MEKKLIRKTVLSKRDALDLEDRDNMDNIMLSTLLEMEWVKKSKNLFIYIGFGTEINTLDYIDKLMEMGKNVYVPYVEKKTNTMEITLLTDPKEQLEPGYYGILEPKEQYRIPVDANHVDLIITPGVAFDRYFNRIGYGGGFYDRFFAKTDGSQKKIALAYDLQVIDETIPTESTDIKVDVIITPSKTYINEED